MKDKKFLSFIILAMVGIVATAVFINIPAGNTGKVSAKEAQAMLGAYATGSPIVYNNKGVGSIDPSLPVVEEFFDYSCAHCANMSVELGSTLTQGAKNGDYNLVFHPVQTSGLIWNNYAVTASLLVAKNDPEHWAVFHENLFDFFASEVKEGRGAVFHDAAKSIENIQKIAKNSGVNDQLVEKMNVDASETYLVNSSKKWGGSETPEIKVNGRVVTFDTWEREKAFAVITQELQDR